MVTKVAGRDGLIYIIGDGIGHFKIGFSNCQGLNARVIDLQCGNPFRLRVVFSRTFPIGLSYHVEKMAHQLLAKYHVRGEWFRGKQQMFIDEVNVCVDRALSMESAMDELALITEEMKAERKASVDPKTETQEVMDEDKGVLRWRGRTGIIMKSPISKLY